MVLSRCRCLRQRMVLVAEFFNKGVVVRNVVDGVERCYVL